MTISQPPKPGPSAYQAIPLPRVADALVEVLAPRARDPRLAELDELIRSEVRPPRKSTEADSERWRRSKAKRKALNALAREAHA